MASNQIRWNLTVSPDTDQVTRVFLANRGGGRKGDMSKFVEEAVRAYIFKLSAHAAKTRNQEVSEDELYAIVEEAIEWARKK